MARHPTFGKPDKEPNPVLLALISQFLSNHGFKSTLRIYSTERQKRSKKDALTDTYGENHTSGIPQLDVILREYLAKNETISKKSSSQDGSSSDGSDEEAAGGDVEMADASSDSGSSSSSNSSSSSSSSSAGSSSDSEEEVAQHKQQKKTLKRKASSSSSSSSSSFSASSSSSESETEQRPTKKVKLQRASSESSSESSISSSSESENEADSESSDSDESAAKVPLPESDSSDSSSSSDSASSDSDNEEETSGKPADAKSDSSGSSSSSSSSDSEESSDPDADIRKPVTKEKSPTPASKPTNLPRASSDSSATLQGDPAPLPPWPTERRKHTGARPTRLAELSATFDENDPDYIDNKYVSYDYADRAYKDLSVTRGKGFTKEKNKKKRGSYRGGAIDTSGGKAFKFED